MRRPRSPVTGASRPEARQPLPDLRIDLNPAVGGKREGPRCWNIMGAMAWATPGRDRKLRSVQRPRTDLRLPLPCVTADSTVQRRRHDRQ